MNKPADLQLQAVPVWINGKAVNPSGRFGEVFNPANGQVTKRVPLCDDKVIDQAAKAAAAALPAWRDTPPLRRARVMQEFLALMRKSGKELGEIGTREEGKTVAGGRGSGGRGIEVVGCGCGIPQLL